MKPQWGPASFQPVFQSSAVPVEGLSVTVTVLSSAAPRLTLRGSSSLPLPPPPARPPAFQPRRLRHHYDSLFLSDIHVPA